MRVGIIGVESASLKMVGEAVKSSGFEVKTLCITEKNKEIGPMVRNYGQINNIKVNDHPIDWANLDVPGCEKAEGKFGPYNKNAWKNREEEFVGSLDALIVIDPNKETKAHFTVRRAKELKIPVYEHGGEKKEAAYNF